MKMFSQTRPKEAPKFKRMAIALSVAATLVATAACSSGGNSLSSPSELGFSDDEASGEAVKVEWFVGLGTGSRVEQIETQEELVAAYNASQDEIELVIELVDNNVAFEVLEQRIADGDVPDIVGPVGVRGVNAFQGQFMDIEPFLDGSSLSLDNYDEEQVEVWRDDDGALTGLPFGVFPSALFYNRDLFEQAGVAEPPHEFGELYEGEVWDMQALYDLSLKLTLDADGRNALDANFDSEQIVQWGFHHQYVAEPRSMGTFFEAGSIVAEDGSAQIPEPWLASWEWYHQLTWEGHGAPNAKQVDSELLASGNSFNSGNIAIAFSHLWYTGNLRDANDQPQTFFDLAVVPSYEGTVTSKVHADTFSIFKASENPAEAFEVIEYLQGPAEAELLKLYGSFPAREGIRADFIAELDATFGGNVDWTVPEKSLAFPDIPHHEGFMPDFRVAEERIASFGSDIQSDPDLDVAAAALELEEDLDAIFAAAPDSTE